MFSLLARLQQQPPQPKPAPTPVAAQPTPLHDRLAHRQTHYALSRRLAAAKRGN